MSFEVWKPVVGFEGYYEVSNTGFVRSIDRTVPIKNSNRKVFVRGRVLSPVIHTWGYQTVCLVKGSHLRKVPLRIHRLVLEAFVGSCPPGLQVAHNDGNPANNHLDNLRYATAKENQQDRVKHGTHLRGERNPRSKLSTKSVESIKKLLPEETLTSIAKKFGVSPSLIWRIKHGKAWRCE